MNKGIVLSVDDDADLQLVIGEYLEDDGYKVITASDVASAMQKAETPDIDVILLDLVLPDGEGLSLIPQFKTKGNAAVIVVSGKSDTTEKVVCLEMGADDYITKPFEMRELSARIKAVMRRMENTQVSPAQEEAKEEKVKFNEGWVLYRSHYQVYKPDGSSADLTTGEFKLLDALIKSANRALTREYLFELTRADGAYDVYDRAIDIQIGRLRKKLDDTDKDDPVIKTVRGVGYMFCKKSA
ncbi:MAG: DNA-binding response regulator [Micavibrio sp.]|nr:DNA-binding response regulator [Micavibrio sp.]